MSMRCCGPKIQPRRIQRMPIAAIPAVNSLVCSPLTSAAAPTLLRPMAAISQKWSRPPDRSQPGRCGQAGQRRHRSDQVRSRQSPQGRGAPRDLADTFAVHRSLLGSAYGDRGRRPSRWHLGKNSTASLNNLVNQPKGENRADSFMAAWNSDPADHPDPAASPLTR
jgi:hypothetical protein